MKLRKAIVVAQRRLAHLDAKIELEDYSEAASHWFKAEAESLRLLIRIAQNQTATLEGETDAIQE